MLISDELKTVFLHNPRCAGTSITHSLVQLGFEIVWENTPNVGRTSHQIDIPIEYKDYFIFTVRRNPYDRFVSNWEKLRARNNFKLSFEESVCNIPTIPYNRLWIPQSNFTQHCDYVICFENLVYDFNKLPFLKESMMLKKVNSVLHKPFVDYFTPELAQKINIYYQKDFEEGGYQKL